MGYQHSASDSVFAQKIRTSNIDQNYENLLSLELNNSQQCVNDIRRGQTLYTTFGLQENINFGGLKSTDSGNTYKKTSFDTFNDIDVFEPSTLENANTLKHRYLGKKNIMDESKSISKFKSHRKGQESSGNWNGKHRFHKKTGKLMEDESAKTDDSCKDFTTSTLNPPINQTNNNNSNYDSLTNYVETTDVFSGYDQSNTETGLNVRTQENKHKKLDKFRADNVDRQYQTCKDGNLAAGQSASSINFEPISFQNLNKDPSMLVENQLLSTHSLDLDLQNFSQNQRDVQFDVNSHFDLAMQKGFSLDSHGLPFEAHIDSCNQNQSNSALSDMSITGHVQQDISLDAYLSVDKDSSFQKKIQSSFFKDISQGDNCFNFDDFCNQTNRDNAQPYFERHEIPHDMTLYQRGHHPKMDSTMILNKENLENSSMSKTTKETSELQKELAKTNTKDSMKGVKTPRDLTRALESLQEFQREQLLKEQDKLNIDKQQQQTSQVYQISQQNHQPQPQQVNSNIMSSPKKTFQSKHNLENMALSDDIFHGPQKLLEDSSHSVIISTDPINLGTEIIPHQSILASATNISSGDTAMTNRRDLCQSQLPSGSSDFESHLLKKLLPSSKFSDQSTNTNIDSVLVDVASSSVPSNLSVSLSSDDLQHDSQKSVKDSNLTSNQSYTFQSIENPDKDEIADLTINASFSGKEYELMSSSRQSLYAMMKQEQFCDAVLCTPKASVKVL